MVEPFVSPTLRQAYEENPSWWEDHGGGLDGRDFDGYDRYGFDRTGLDRAGWKAGDYNDSRLSRRCHADASVAGVRLASASARRIPEPMAKAVVDRTLAMLSERFPYVPVIDMEAPVIPAEQGAVIMCGTNATREKYVGAVFPDKGGAYFSVIVEAHVALMAAADRRATWTATVLYDNIGSGEGIEKRCFSIPSLDELMDEIARELDSFSPLSLTDYAIFLAGAGTQEPGFGAMPVDDFEALSLEARPGDRLTTVRELTAAAALEAFAGQEPRSPAFTAMIEKCLEQVNEVPLSPRL